MKALPRVINISLILFWVLCTVSCNGGGKAVTDEKGGPNTQSIAATAAVYTEPVETSILMPMLLKYQQPRIRFGNLTPENGLSQSVVTDIVQDEFGFLWFATQDGLNRYDGYEFRVFSNNPHDQNSLSNNFVQSIDRDQAGNIWIGTGNSGLDRYDPLTGQFTHYQHDPANSNSLSDNIVNFVLAGDDGLIWAGTTNGGLNVLDPKTGKFTHYLFDPQDPASLSSNNVITLLEEGPDKLWVGTATGGLNCLDRRTGRFTRYQNNPGDSNSLGQNGILSLLLDRQDRLWVGLFDGGLDRFDPHTGGFTHFRYDSANPTALSHDTVQYLFEDSRGKFWVATNGGGVNLFDPQTGKFTHFRNSPNDAGSLPNDGVLTIFEDQSGMVWFGTFGAGAAMYDPYKDKFLLLSTDPASQDSGASSLSSNMVWGMYEDANDVLWIGTYGGGLNRYDTRNGSWKSYTMANSGLSSDTVFSILEDGEGIFWLGSYDGLNRFDPRTETFEMYADNQIVFPTTLDSTGMLWFGTAASGLGRLGPGENTSFFYTNTPDDPRSISSNNLTALSLDAVGNLWIGTVGGGLNRFIDEGQGFVHYMNDPADPHSISSNIVLCIYPLPDGALWLGTYEGLNYFDPETGEFTAYTTQHGLPNNVVYGILEDDHGRLWLSTNRGLSQFDPQTLEFRNYDRSDGLQGLEFNQGSYLKNAQGVMFFGGVNGVNIFHPDLVQANPFIPPVVITGFELFGKPVQVGDDGLLKQPIEAAQELELHYTDDFFEFQFAALHFSSPQENRYAYKLQPLDRDWNYVDNRRFATYTNVPPGNYTLLVKGSNPDGVWNEHPAALKIVIPPPFWQTLWFRLLLGTTIIGMVAGAVALRIRSIEAQRQRLEKLVGERTHQLRDAMLELEKSRDAAESANRAKSVFLANMSHEFRTPLNAILGFTQIMQRDQRMADDQRENLQIIHRSSEHLLGLINDVLDMSKIEAGRTTLRKNSFDLHHMLEGLDEMFSMRARKKGIGLALELSPQTPRFIHADEGKLRQVLMNLLGNAVKFTQQGRVTLRVYPIAAAAERSQNAVRLGFEVEDSGPGIAPDEIEQMFIPFIQTLAGQKSQEGTGLGLSISQQFIQLMGSEIQVRSQVGKGSLFSFEIWVDLVDGDELTARQQSRLGEPQVIGLEAGQSPCRILVVDDQPVNRRLLVSILTPVGFEIKEAANGQEALCIWQDWQPHLIWMDMRMPVMDGYEATRRIKATTQGQATIIVALTASGLEEDKAVILSEGCDDYMRKPFLEADLFAMIAKHLGVRYIYQVAAPEMPVSPAGVPVESLPGASTTAVSTNLTEQLASMELDWLGSLERATLLGDEQSIFHLAGQILPVNPSLANKLTSLASKFEHENILSAIEQARYIIASRL